jgi:hypothetical protein
MKTKIRPEELSEYRLVRIKYDHTKKEYESFPDLLDKEDLEFVASLDTSRPNETIAKKSSVSDWVWCTSKELERMVEIMDKHTIRYKITDHTSEYYKSPEKVSTLRERVDEWMAERIDADFVLDRISCVGLENISKFERKILEKQSKTI